VSGRAARRIPWAPDGRCACCGDRAGGAPDEAACADGGIEDIGGSGRAPTTNDPLPPRASFGRHAADPGNACIAPSDGSRPRPRRHSDIGRRGMFRERRSGDPERPGRRGASRMSERLAGGPLHAKGSVARDDHTKLRYSGIFTSATRLRTSALPAGNRRTRRRSASSPGCSFLPFDGGAAPDRARAARLGGVRLSGFAENTRQLSITIA